MTTDSDTISHSARNATFLVLLQISSRGFTFIVNQILLRYLSPTLLGISQQLELFAISVLYFSRESLRVALQRQTIETQPSKSESKEQASGPTTSPKSTRLQEVINLSYLPILVGPILAFLFAWLYLSKASPESLAVPYLRPSVQLFCIATVFELTAEPCFAFAAQRQLIRLRAAAETTATLSRCVVTVATAILGSRSGTVVGALPFAFGQCAYAVGLWIVYYGYVLGHSDGEFSILPKTISNGTAHTLSLFPNQTLSLASSLYAQSGLKHILTQGDALLITLFADLSSQGVFALASNYGSLLARMFFQPIEESSRTLFGRTLSGPVLSTSSPLEKKQAIPKDNLRIVHTYLTTLLRFYAHLALILLILAPPLSAPLLSLLAGQAWRASSAPRILSKYCYYLPFLAYNGLLEAFVSATATPAELQTQSMAMLVFSGVFAAAGYLLLVILGRGVDGILEANMCNMAVRILWSRSWVEQWWSSAQSKHAHGGKPADVPDLRIFGAETLPHPTTITIAVGTWAMLWQYAPLAGTQLRNFAGIASTGGTIENLVDIVAIAVMGLPLLASIVWYEWDTFVGPVVQRILSLAGMKLNRPGPEIEKKTM